MADAIIDRLVTARGLEVIGPISARAATRGAGPESTQEILGVDLLLRGSLRSSDRTVDIEVRLERGPSWSELWSARWSVPEADVFRLQSRIAHRVGSAAGVELPTPGDALIHREPTTDLAAYALHAEGRDLLLNPEGPDAHGALECFESSTELDGLYADAWGSIARAHRVLTDLGLQGVTEPLQDPVTESAERALELDDTLAEAHVSIGYAELRGWRLDSAEANLRLALELAPGHAEAHRWLSRCLMYRGDFDAAIEAAERAAALEPLSRDIVNESGWPYALAGRHEEAVERSRRVVHRDPEYAMAYFHLGRYAEQADRATEAVTYFRAASALSGRVPFLTAFLGMALVEAGDRHEAEEIAHDLERKATRGSPVAGCLGALLVRLGRVDEGLGWLETAATQRDPLLLLADTHWLPLPTVRTDARFQALLGRLPAPCAAGRRP